MKVFCLGLLSLIATTVCFAQGLTNNGDTISVKAGSILFISGNLENINKTGLYPYIKNNGNLYVTGDVKATPNTTYTGLDSFYLYGSGNQIFPSFNFNNLILQNGGYKTLTGGGNSTIYNNLNIISGVLKTGNDSIILNGSATLTESATGYLRGNVKSIKTLPLGTAVTFGHGVVITRNGSNNPGNVIITRVSDKTLIGSPVLRRNLNTSYKNAEAKYVITPSSNGHLDANITFKYHDSLLNGCVESALNTFRKYQGGSIFWYTGKTAQNTTLNTITDQHFDSFTQCILGGSVNILPVELLNFNARLLSYNSALLSWETASEFNNDFFQLERSEDAINWQSITRLKGKNSTNQLSYYDFIDDKLALIKSDKVYYRLKQVDFNGAYEYSMIRVLNLVRKDSKSIVSFYNSNEKKIFINVNSENVDFNIKSIALYSMDGKQLYQKQNIDHDLKQFKIDCLLFSQSLYSLIVETTDGTYSQKIPIIGIE